MKPKLLDLFCGAGGASMGYAQAGFDVYGIDHEPQPNYPFWLKIADALEFPVDDFDVIHASPPCQAFSKLRHLHPDIEYPDLISATRAKLQQSGKPWVIENVPGAPLIDPIQLCGSSFGLRIRRHRLFESNVGLKSKDCDHGWQKLDPIYTKARWHGGKRELIRSGVVIIAGGGEGLQPPYNEGDEWRKQMACPWMSRTELTQAIPPPYTKFIGDQLMQRLKDDDL